MEPEDMKDDLTQWETIINSVDKTDIPICFVSRVIFSSDHYDIETEITDNEIDIGQLRQIGYDDHDIQEIINQVLSELQHLEGTMDFRLDIAEVAKTVKPITNEYLQRM